MSEKTPNLSLPYIIAAQAQKHVTHNEAIRALDALTQLSVEDKDLTTPPPSPDEGACYIVATSATGDWSGKETNIAAYQDGAWMYYPPEQGWTTWVRDEDSQMVFDGTNWLILSGGGGDIASVNPTPLIGVNATADTTNRLSINSPASLFNHDGDDHQMKVNKSTTGDNASVLFQTNFSGRAEFGLAGDDDFHMKVSPDGTTFYEGIIIDKDTGVVTFPNTTFSGGSVSSVFGRAGAVVSVAGDYDFNDIGAVPQNRILGRISASTGLTEALTPADTRIIINVEDGATADQTGPEISTALFAEADTNNYNDAAATKLGAIEVSADVTDATNVVSSLDGASLTTETVATDDYILIQDTSDGGSIKKVTAQSVGDLGGGGGSGSGDEWSDIVDADIIPDGDGTRNLGTDVMRFAEAYTDALDVTNNITVGGTVDGRDVAADGTKLDNIEASATADQTGTEISTLLFAEGNTNNFDDAAISKLSAIEASADVTDETNVITSLSGAFLSAVAVATGDKVLVQDADDSDALKSVTAQSIADLAATVATDLQLGSDARGDIAFYDGSNYARLSADNGKFLKSQGTSADPIWETIPGGGDMLVSNNLSDVLDPAVARVNLGISASVDTFANNLLVAELRGDLLEINNGIADPLANEDNIDLPNCSDQSYQSGFYTNAASFESDGNPSQSYGDVPMTLFNRDRSLTNGANLSKIGVSLNSAQPIHFKIARRNSSNNYDIIVSESYSHGGTGFEDLTLSSPFNVPASGEYLIGVYTTVPGPYVANARARIDSNPGVQTGLTTDSENSNAATRSIRLTYAASNMTLISKSFTAASSPDSANFYVLSKSNGAMTINTDLIGSVSRNDGLAYEPVTLIPAITYANDTILYQATDVDLSAQSSGTDMRWKVKTNNGKDIEVHAAELAWIL